MNPAVSPRVTPTTAALLQWWFDPPCTQARAGLGFHDEQRREILRTIAAHEALDGDAPPRERPVHRVALSTGIDQIRVLLALLVWQLLNHRDALAAGLDDPRFTSHFIAVAHHARARDRLFATFSGQPVPGSHGARDFGTAGLVRLAELLIPGHRRDEVYGFVCAHVCSGAQFVRQPVSDGVIAISDGRLEALECLARLPRVMVFDDESHPPHWARGIGGVTSPAWRQHLRRIASSRDELCAQVVFSQGAHREAAEPSWL
ncbi:hypothetical protein [Hydrogenophaga sp. PBL-H3]|uniref:hypothetical protein n=1 Tax=Hydrogenophaga sp. PBL-H3 TaxID=434010 RepID=UPI0013204CDF|nr:hypothetical protein [Hydrogenophaga sp. PBL-H3]QHE74711.1 hypothetical protein F9Z45_00955 [Hydrogenophaga sp. PBL-H3]QHE79137.1 hypothetical protein F9Z44_00955 [Hydrogenophaga sp. PBL-H3]